MPGRMPHTAHTFWLMTRATHTLPPTAEQFLSHVGTPLASEDQVGLRAPWPDSGRRHCQNPRRQTSPPGCGGSVAEPPVQRPQGKQRAPRTHWTLHTFSRLGKGLFVTHSQGASLTDARSQQDLPVLGPLRPCTSARDSAPTARREGSSQWPGGGSHQHGHIPVTTGDTCYHRCPRRHAGLGTAPSRPASRRCPAARTPQERGLGSLPRRQTTLPMFRPRVPTGS